MEYPIRFAEHLREHIRALRKQHGLTQAQLGEKLGLGQARIAEIESRPGQISVDQLLKLLSVLDATMVVWQERKLSGGTSLLTKADKTPATTSNVKTLRALNPAKEVVPTSARNVVIRPRKGAW